MKRIFLFFLLILGVVSVFLWKQNPPSEVQNVLSHKEEQTIPVVSEKTPARPIRLTITKLGVSANLESVGMDENGAMDVPKDPFNAAWYNLGFRPGSNGSAVIAGHVDTPQGSPAVFADIKSLQVGDEITVTDEENSSYTYAVTNIVSYAHDEVPLKAVFDDRSGKKLNLITCDGTWDTASKNYSNRIVVYAQIKE